MLLINFKCNLWVGIGVSVLAACGSLGDGTVEAEVSESSASLRNHVQPGDPLPELNQAQRDLFYAGEARFVHAQSPAQGLGPIYIERACVSCHALGGIGGADALVDPNHFVERFGTTNPDGTYANLASLGGDVLQTRSIANQVPGCLLPPEQVPAITTINGLRSPLPMFGIGLIAAIPDATILAGAIDRGDGIHGRANLAPNGRPGRFGWKAQSEDLAAFNAGAANGTMGITSARAAGEQLPQGQPIPIECSAAVTGATSPNDADGSFIGLITAWELMLAPPAPKSIHGAAARGRQVFYSVGCAKCHVPEMQTGPFSLTLLDGTSLPVEALEDKTAALYSDLLLHDMGPALDEGVTMRQAQGSEFRTAPLWGLRLRTRYLHDGRAGTLHEAISAHGGEAEVVRDRYLAMSVRNRRNLLRFLRRL